VAHERLPLIIDLWPDKHAASTLGSRRTQRASGPAGFALRTSEASLQQVETALGMTIVPIFGPAPDGPATAEPGGGQGWAQVRRYLLSAGLVLGRHLA